MTKACFIFNPRSGYNISNPQVIERTRRFIAEQNAAGALDARLVSTEHPHHATALARDALADGCTLWWRQKLAAPVVISYEVTMSADARVSDMNCFWMASDPKNPGDLFYENNGRTGKFSTYDSLNTYYVGYGGNGNTSTRFRRYDGTGARPLLPEHDLADAAHLLKAGHAYKIELIASDGEARFVCDGETVFRYADPKPLTEGWFGFRTVNSKMVIRNFRVTKPGGVTKSE